MTLYHELCEDRFAQLEPNSIDLIISNPPYNISENAAKEHVIGGFEDRRGFRRHMGKWDKEFNPVPLIANAARTLTSGGWLILKTGDRTLGLYRDLISGDHSTTAAYLDSYFLDGLVSTEQHSGMLERLKQPSLFQPYFEYKATVTVHKTNPPSRIRRTTYASSCEWLVIAKRLGPDGESVEPVAWNFLSQREMRNHFEVQSCRGHERLYWHVQDPVIEDGDIVSGGRIIPCRHKPTCAICEEGRKLGLQDENLPWELKRRHHPTQDPSTLWRWILKRHSIPGLRMYDPFAGVSSSLMVARQMGLHILGSEANWEFATAGQMWLGGKWPEPIVEKSGVEYETVGIDL